MNWFGGGLVILINYARGEGRIGPLPGNTLGTENLNVIGTEAGDSLGVT